MTQLQRKYSGTSEQYRTRKDWRDGYLIQSTARCPPSTNLLPRSIYTLPPPFFSNQQNMEDKVAAKAEAQWYDKYPAVKSQDVPVLSRSDFLGMINAGASPGQDFLLVDLRRNDHVVCNSLSHLAHRRSTT